MYVKYNKILGDSIFLFKIQIKIFLSFLRAGKKLRCRSLGTPQLSSFIQYLSLHANGQKITLTHTEAAITWDIHSRHRDRSAKPHQKIALMNEQTQIMKNLNRCFWKFRQEAADSTPPRHHGRLSSGSSGTLCCRSDTLCCRSGILCCRSGTMCCRSATLCIRSGTLCCRSDTLRFR